MAERDSGRLPCRVFVISFWPVIIEGSCIRHYFSAAHVSGVSHPFSPQAHLCPGKDACVFSSRAENVAAAFSGFLTQVRVSKSVGW